MQVEARPEASTAIHGEAKHRPPQHGHLLLKFSGVGPEDVLHPERKTQFAKARCDQRDPGGRGRRRAVGQHGRVGLARRARTDAHRPRPLHRTPHRVRQVGVGNDETIGPKPISILRHVLGVHTVGR